MGHHFNVDWYQNSWGKQSNQQVGGDDQRRDPCPWEHADADLDVGLGDTTAVDPGVSPTIVEGELSPDYVDDLRRSVQGEEQSPAAEPPPHTDVGGGTVQPATRDRVAGTRSSDRAPPRRGEVEWSQPPHRTNPSFVRGRTTQRERPNRRSAGRTDWIDGDNNKVRRPGSLPDDFKLDRGRSRSGSYSSMGPAEKPIEGDTLEAQLEEQMGDKSPGSV